MKIYYCIIVSNEKNILHLEIKMSYSNGKKKLKISAVLFALSLVAIGIGVAFLVLYITGQLKSPVFVGLAMVAVIAGIVMFYVSLFKNLSYRKMCRADGKKPGGFSNFLYGWLNALIWPYYIYLKIMSFFAAGNADLKKVTVKDGEGNVYSLTQTYIGSDEYTDQNGDLWRACDHGMTFERVVKDVKVKGDDGKEHTLTPTYDEFVTKHYTDQNGEEWISQDGGTSFEHLLTEADVTDEAGNKYHLRAVQAGLCNFIDQNGDLWTTDDGGKTFRRR